MKIGVISDTHMRSPNPLLEKILTEVLADTDMILHAGDIVGFAVLERMHESGVIAVCGNMDDHQVAGHIPQMRIVEAGGKRVGLIHGWGSKEGLEPRIIERFEEPKPDVIVYGHTHVPFWGEINGVPMFNPGSANSRGYGGTGTAGILEINGSSMNGKIISVES